jgi:hypothetical protein
MPRSRLILVRFGSIESVGFLLSQNAKYAFAKVEDEYFSGPGGRNRPNFALYEDSVLPVIEAGQAEMIEADGAEFIGDVMHLPVQVYRPDWSSVFSASPERGRLSRLWALERAAERRTLFFSSHFPGSSAGLVERDRDRFRWRWL